MGMNFYLRCKPCKTCHHVDAKKHIGKSSYGWQFNFRAYPDECIVCYKDWLEQFKDINKEIVNECGDVFSVEQFKDLVFYKKDGLNHYNIVSGLPMTQKEKEYVERNRSGYRHFDAKCWKDDEGNTFSNEEFC
jgi:hypothetical protein